MLHITLFGNITIWWIPLFSALKDLAIFCQLRASVTCWIFHLHTTLGLVFEKARVEGQIRKNVLCFMLRSWNLGTQSAGYILLGWLFSEAQCAQPIPLLLKEFHSTSTNLDYLCKDHRKPSRSGINKLCPFLHSWLQFNPWNLIGGKTAFF